MGWREVEVCVEEKQSDGRAFQKLILGEYKWLSYAEADQKISHIASGLIAIGVKQHDKVVIYAETCKEWMITAIACFKLGIPVVTVYATLGEEAVAYAMKESDAVAVVTTKSLLPKVNAVIKGSDAIKRIIYLYDAYPNPGEPLEASKKVVNEIKKFKRDVYSLDELVNEGKEKMPKKVNVDAEHMAMVMYTSGTTGTPKGVMLSHKNIISAITGASKIIQTEYIFHIKVEN